MRVSTRPRTSATPAAASATSGAPEPKTSPDGHFVLVCSDGQRLTNIGRNQSYRFPRHPVRYDGPDVWYADYNQHGFPNTLRIYRLDGDDCPKEVYEYTYVPEIKDWKLTLPQRPDSGTNKETQSRKPRAKPSPSAAFLLAIVRRLARLFLWPIADANWRAKLLNRQRLLGFAPTQTHFMNELGFLTLFGDTFMSVQLRVDGSVLVYDQVLRPRKWPRAIPRPDDPEKPWIEWYGDMLVIKGEDRDAILTYELGHWQQWGPCSHTISEIIGRDLDITRRMGEKFLGKGLPRLWNVALAVFVLLFVFGMYDMYRRDFSDSKATDQSSVTSEELNP